MLEAEAKPEAKPRSAGEILLAGVSLACWLAATPFVVIDAIAPYAPSLRETARLAGPVVGFALPLAVGSMSALMLRRPPRSRSWRTFQVGMLILSMVGLGVAIVRYAL